MGYDKTFFNFLKDTSVESANHIVPICLDLINPKKVLDVGCGRGSFLKLFADNGVEFINGIDGDWVNEGDLDIPLKFFRYADLEKKVQIYDKFDLAICLEVAEHLTSGRAPSFVDDLCRLSDVVLFSAAIPFQGGTNHINERPITYWADLFKKIIIFGLIVLEKKYGTKLLFGTHKTAYYLLKKHQFHRILDYN